MAVSFPAVFFSPHDPVAIIPAVNAAALKHRSRKFRREHPSII
jgi:hypothetical protein